MHTDSPFKKLLLGPALAGEMDSGNIEFRRRASILLVLTSLALILLPVFSALSFSRGDTTGASVNLAVFAMVMAGYIHMRLKGVLVVAAYIFVGVFCAQFISDFSTDISSAMWSFTIPIMCFFLLGMRGGAIFSALYLLLTVGLMFLVNADMYPFDFKVRFPVIFFAIAFFTFNYEKSRLDAQANMEKANRQLEMEKAKLAESDRSLKYFKSLLKGKTITLSDEKKKPKAGVNPKAAKKRTKRD